MKRCFYEVLQVEKTATTEEIKFAYKKQALIHHPDKNPEKDTKAIFQEIIEAYKVLSDPNERSWYDNHRNQILNDKHEFSPEDAEYENFGMKNFKDTLSPNFYDKIDDSDSGFYKKFRDLFQYLAMKEQQAAEERNMEDDFIKLPGFGDSKSNLDDVEKFYDYWDCFSTFKQFTYADEWKLQEGESRYIRRLMEKENKQHRDEEKREFMKKIKALLDYLRKKDPRYKELQKQEILKEQEKLRLKKEKEEQIKLEKQEKMRVARELEKERWKQTHDQEEAKDIVYLEFYCEVCSKAFKSQSQFDQHENSKLHHKNLKELLKEIAISKQEEDEVVEQEKTKKKKQNYKKKKRNNQEAGIEENKNDNHIQQEEIQTESKSIYEKSNEELKKELSPESYKRIRNEKKKQKQQQRKKSEISESQQEQEEEKKQNFQQKKKKSTQTDKSEEDDADINLGFLIKNKKQNVVEQELNEEKNKVKQDKQEQNNNTFYQEKLSKKQKILNEVNNKEDIEEQMKKLEKKEKRKEKNKEKNEKKEEQKQKEKFKCKTCNKNFETNGLLFKHIKLSNHAALLNQLMGNCIKSQFKKNQKKQKLNPEYTKNPHVEKQTTPKQIQNKNKADLYKNLGNKYFKENKIQEAIQEYQKAIVKFIKSKYTIKKRVIILIQLYHIKKVSNMMKFQKCLFKPQSYSRQMSNYSITKYSRFYI